MKRRLLLVCAVALVILSTAAQVSADIELSQADVSSTIIQGETTRYTVTITNTGADMVNILLSNSGLTPGSGLSSVVRYRKSIRPGTSSDATIIVNSALDTPADTYVNLLTISPSAGSPKQLTVRNTIICGAYGCNPPCGAYGCPCGAYGCATP